MEELRSTEILDKEIQEDARKKAEKIIILSKEESQKIIDSVDDKINNTRKEKEQIYAEKKARFEKDSGASLPLEKQRYVVSFEEQAVTTAIQNYLTSLSKDKRELLLKNLLIKYKLLLADKKVTIVCSGFECSVILSLVSSVLDKKNIISCEKMSNAQENLLSNDGKNFIDGFVIETEDHKIKCRITLAEIVDDIKDQYSFELANTLFGGRLPE